MSELEEMMNETVALDGEDAITLSTLADFDLANVEEVRGSNFPAGTFQFSVKADPVPTFAIVEVNDPEVPGAKIKRAQVKFCLECLNVVEMPPKQKDGTVSPAPESVIGRDFYQTFFIKTGDDIGRVKAFLTDIGAQNAGKFADLLLSSVGARFQAPIKQVFKKDDHDVIYTNLDRNKIKVLEA